MPACLARFRLRFAEKFIITDHFLHFVQRRVIIAAVVPQRGKILENDFVVVGEFVGWNEIAVADFGAVDPQLFGGNVEQTLHDKDAVLPACAAIGRDDGFVGKNADEFAVISGNIIAAKQRALAVERHGQSIGGVGAGVVEEFIANG